MKAYITGTSIVLPNIYYTEQGFREWGNNDNSGTIPSISTSFFKREYPRFTRYDPFSKLVCMASTQLIRNTGIREDVLTGEKTGIILGTMTGSLSFDMKHLDRIFSKGLQAASPQIFSFTLPSTALGEVAIYYKITGTNYIINRNFFSGMDAIADAFFLMQNGTLDRAIAGSADSINKSIIDLIEQNDGYRPIPSAFLFFMEKTEPESGKFLFSIESPDAGTGDISENEFAAERNKYLSSAFISGLADPIFADAGLKLTLPVKNELNKEIIYRRGKKLLIFKPNE